MVLGRDREGYFRRKFNLRTPSTFRRSRQSTILQLLNRLLAFLQIPLVGLWVMTVADTRPYGRSSLRARQQQRPSTSRSTYGTVNMRAS